MEKLKKQFSLRMVYLENEVIVLEAPRSEVETIELGLRAGKQTDPAFRHATDTETEALHKTVFQLLGQTHANSVVFSLSKDEFLNITSIIEAVNTMDPEIYYAEIVESFPSDDDFHAFTEHISAVYQQAFQ